MADASNDAKPGVKEDVERAIAGLKRKLSTITEPAKRAEFILKLHALGADVSGFVKDFDGDISGLTKDVKPVVEESEQDAKGLESDADQTVKDARSLVPEGRTSAPQVTAEGNSDSSDSAAPVKRGPGRPPKSASAS